METTEKTNQEVQSFCKMTSQKYDSPFLVIVRDVALIGNQIIDIHEYADEMSADKFMKNQQTFDHWNTYEKVKYERAVDGMEYYYVSFRFAAEGFIEEWKIREFEDYQLIESMAGTFDAETVNSFLDDWNWLTFMQVNPNKIQILRSEN